MPEQDIFASTTCGTPYYMSPERFECVSYSKESDYGDRLRCGSSSVSEEA